MNRYQRVGGACRSSAQCDARLRSGIWAAAALTAVALGAGACSNPPATPARVYSGSYHGVGGTEVPTVAFTVTGSRVVGFTTGVVATCTLADGGTAEQVLTLPDPHTVTTHVQSGNANFYDFSDTYTVPGAAGAVIQVTAVGHLLGGGEAYGTIAVSTVQGPQPGCRTSTGPAGWSLVHFGR